MYKDVGTAMPKALKKGVGIQKSIAHSYTSCINTNHGAKALSLQEYSTVAVPTIMLWKTDGPEVVTHTAQVCGIAREYRMLQCLV